MGCDVYCRSDRRALGGRLSFSVPLDGDGKNKTISRCRRSCRNLHADFLFLTQSPLALAFILGTHFLIDRFRLARFVVWLKNGYMFTEIGPATATGYHNDVPPWLAVWLLIVADNTIHLICNGIALAYL